MIQFTCTDELVKTLEINGIAPHNYKPAYNGESVGLDLYNASDITYVIKQDNIYIPTGLRVLIPNNHVGLICYRGSSSKTLLMRHGGVIDPGFTGEIFLAAKSISDDKSVDILPHSKLVFQLIVVPCISQYGYISPDIYEEVAKMNRVSRGTNQLGSSN